LKDLWPHMYQDYPEYQFALMEQFDQIIAIGNSIAIHWDGQAQNLPKGWDGALAQGMAEHQSGRTGNTLVVLAGIVDPRYRTRKLSNLIIEGFKLLAQQHQLTHIVVALRPIGKGGQYQSMDIEQYSQLTNEAGYSVDGWLRLHQKMGGQVIGVETQSQYVEGTIADWQEWGDEDHTLAPVKMDQPIDLGIYYDPCIWVQHPLEAGAADVFEQPGVAQLTAQMKKTGEPLPDHLLIVDQSAAQLLNTATPKSIKQWLTRLQVFVSPLFDTTVIARKLTEVLPAHMMPSHYLLLDALPLMPSGKIDKKTLLKLGDKSGTKQAKNKAKYVAPSGEIQRALADIWARMLQCERATISANDNFFELGGHSLLSVRLASIINADWGLELKIRDIFEAPKLWQLARLVSDWVDQQHQSVKTPSIIAFKNTGELPTSYAQQQLWFIDKMAGGSSDHNMAGALKLEGQFNVTVAEQAFKRIISRHQPLRTVFKDGDEGPVQVIRTNVEFILNRVDLTDLKEQNPKAAQQQAIDDAMKADAATAFDLSLDLMLRASFLHCSVNAGVLLLNIHHIAADGWSIGILLDEFVQQYQAIEAGKPDPLPPLTVQYGDFAQWQ
ncbi:MAG: hypothetical protein HRT35_38525, partial [Algicola sp.]|nr:hypothetical protein [Algicola sp.]